MSKRNGSQTRRGPYARSGETRARILQAALAEASGSGLHNATVARIAERAEVAVGVLNYHFGSRREMLRELMAMQVQALLSLMTPPERDADFFSCEAAMVSTYLQFLRSHPNYVRLAEEIRLHDPELYRQGTITHLAHTERRLRRGIGRGDLPPMGDVAITIQAYFIMGTLTFLDRLTESDSYPGDAAVTATYISFLRTGLNTCGAQQQVSHEH